MKQQQTSLFNKLSAVRGDGPELESAAKSIYLLWLLQLPQGSDTDQAAQRLLKSLETYRQSAELRGALPRFAMLLRQTLRLRKKDATAFAVGMPRQRKTGR